MQRHFPAFLLLLAAAARVAADPICFEAESGFDLEPPARIGPVNAAVPGMPPADGASGGKYIEIPQGAGNPPAVTTGSIAYRFTIAKAGTYYLWCRAWWLDECGNSVGVQVNELPPFTLGDSTFKTWHWVKAPPRLKQLNLAAGEHTLMLLNREDGVRIDQILLTTDRRFVPVDAETVTVP